jgi:hypothetical protein
MAIENSIAGPIIPITLIDKYNLHIIGRALLEFIKI